MERRRHQHVQYLPTIPVRQQQWRYQCVHPGWVERQSLDRQCHSPGFFIRDNTVGNAGSVQAYTTNGSVTITNVDLDNIDDSTAINVVITGTGSASLSGVDIDDGTDGSGITVTTNSGNITLADVDVTNQSDGYTANLQTQSGSINITNGTSNGSTFEGGGVSLGFVANNQHGPITITGTSGGGNQITFTGADGSANNGATLSAPIVTLTRVTADNNDRNGIQISNVNQVTLNNVIATNNGTNIGGGTGGGGYSNDIGSGVYVSGSVGSFISVLDGTFTGNERYGIEVANPLNTSIFIGSSIDSCQTTGSSGGCTNVTPTTDTTAPGIAFVSRTPAANGSWLEQLQRHRHLVVYGRPIWCGFLHRHTNRHHRGFGQSVTGVCVNKAGLTATNTQSGINIDKTAPGIAFTSKSPSANGNGWNSTNVAVNWSCTDSLSGMASATTSQTVTTEGANQSSTGTCTDRAGNSASNTQTGINIDKSAPTGVALTPTGTLGTNGWYTSDVTITTTGTDSISGPVTCTGVQALNSDSAGTTFNGSCTNLAGVTANASPLTVKRDATNPVITFVSRTPANGSGWNNGNVTVNWSCTDANSGPVNAAVNQTVTTEGSN